MTLYLAMRYAYSIHTDNHMSRRYVKETTNYVSPNFYCNLYVDCWVLIFFDATSKRLLRNRLTFCNFWSLVVSYQFILLVCRRECSSWWRSLHDWNSILHIRVRQINIFIENEFNAYISTVWFASTAVIYCYDFDICENDQNKIVSR